MCLRLVFSFLVLIFVLHAVPGQNSSVKKIDAAGVGLRKTISQTVGRQGFYVHKSDRYRMDDVEFAGCTLSFKTQIDVGWLDKRNEDRSAGLGGGSTLPRGGGDGLSGRPVGSTPGGDIQRGTASVTGTSIGRPSGSMGTVKRDGEMAGKSIINTVVDLSQIDPSRIAESAAKVDRMKSGYNGVKILYTLKLFLKPDSTNEARYTTERSPRTGKNDSWQQRSVYLTVFTRTKNY